MTRKEELIVKLPLFVIDSTLSRSFTEQLPDYQIRASGRINFDWSDVRFFDDYTLLKLILIQRQLRLNGCRVSNLGFFSYSDANKQSVLRQLWTVGMPELTASGHLIGGNKLKEALEDDAKLLESDPLSGSSSLRIATAVIPMLCCHERKHFAAGSREEKQLDSFVKACLRPTNSKSQVWDLVESRDFRHLMLQQLRRNVHEHSRRDGVLAIGLAIVRVWTAGTLTDEWRLTDDLIDHLMRAWNREPVALVLRKIGPERGILQVSVVDDGVGIPLGLEGVHDALLKRDVQPQLFSDDDHLHYTDLEFERRFADPASWKDNKSRLIAFAMDRLGTSKRDRAPEVKGLEYLREQAVIEMNGAACLESDGAGVDNVTRDRQFGQPRQIQLGWCVTGGVGVCLAIPMTRIESRGDNRKISFPRPGVYASKYVELGTNRFKVKDHLPARPKNGKSYEEGELADCANELLRQIIMPHQEEDMSALRSRGLLIIDWGALPDSKRVFHNLLDKTASKLAAADQRQMRPFVFANLPKGLCGLLGKTISTYSKEPPIPICTFTAEHREPFWLGLDSDNTLPEDLRRKLKYEIRRKITDKKENRTEAFFRDSFSQLLTAPKPLSTFDAAALIYVQKEDYAAIRDSASFSRLKTLFDRCSLFREEKLRSPDGEMSYTGRFEPVFQMDEIEAVVRSLFLDEFRDTFTRPPVCFTPPHDKEGVRLPHSKRVIKRYFRSDALVDSPIAEELTQELVAIALGIAKQCAGERIDWVVSCTSPLHWFVHRIVDGLAENNIDCSHFVFPSYEEISASMENITMKAGETVLIFTDVIASGNTSYQMAASLINHFKNIKMAGLIALADIRTKEDRESGPELDKIYDGRIVCFYNEPEPHRADLKATYYVHPETVVPKKNLNTNPMEEFFDKNYSGIGPLIVNHGYFNNAQRTLDLMVNLDALHFGHYQHGSHHSEVYVDVEKVLSCGEYRNLIVTALFRYIIEHDIRLVLYPNHSSAYILADELKQRFVITSDSPVEFIMACRTFRGRGTQGTGYTLTRFSPHPEMWKKFSQNSVLILDDAVCSGATIESIIAELARIDRHYYDSPTASSSDFSVHVVAFLNRMPRVTGEFWGGLSSVAKGRVQLSAFIRIPLAADSEEVCPQCLLEKKLKQEINSRAYCYYAVEFMSWWLSQSAVVSSHERQHTDYQFKERFSPSEALRLAGYISAIERKAYDQVSENLYDRDGKPAAEVSKAVRIHIRSRSGLLHDQYPKTVALADNAKEYGIVDLCNELEALIDMTLDKAAGRFSQSDVLEILQFLVRRYFEMRRNQKEFIRVMDCLLKKLAIMFDDRLVVGGIATVFDTYLGWPDHIEDDRKAIRDAVKESVKKIDKNELPEKASLFVDWFDTYLSEGGRRIDSVGKAVKMLADFAKKGQSNHFYGRHELDELKRNLELPLSKASADAAIENMRRALMCCEQFLELVKATRVLQSTSPLQENDIRDLQNATEHDIQNLRRLCSTTGLNTDEELRNYEEIKTLFLRSFNRWFPESEHARSKPVEIISFFTPNLRETLMSSWESYTPRYRKKEDIKIDMTQLSDHNSVTVLIDPRVLTTSMHQLFDNVDKLAEKNAGANMLCQIYLPESDRDGTQSNEKIFQDMVSITVSNSDTPRPNLAQIKLRGLAGVKMRLAEFGGRLTYSIPEVPWSFQVNMDLPMWTEEEL